MTDDTKLYTLAETAEHFRKSTRWVRDKCKDGAEHIRLGREIRFTREQIASLEASLTVNTRAESITTGRKKAS